MSEPGTMTWLNRYTDERETIPATDEAIDEFFETRDPHDWIEDRLETDEPVSFDDMEGRSP